MAGVEEMEVDSNVSEKESEPGPSKPAQAAGKSSKKGGYELPW